MFPQSDNRQLNDASPQHSASERVGLGGDSNRLGGVGSYRTSGGDDLSSKLLGIVGCLPK